MDSISSYYRLERALSGKLFSEKDVLIMERFMEIALAERDSVKSKHKVSLTQSSYLFREKKGVQIASITVKLVHSETSQQRMILSTMDKRIGPMCVHIWRFHCSPYRVLSRIF